MNPAHVGSSELFRVLVACKQKPTSQSARRSAAADRSEDRLRYAPFLLASSDPQRAEPIARPIAESSCRPYLSMSFREPARPAARWTPLNIACSRAGFVVAGSCCVVAPWPTSINNTSFTGRWRLRAVEMTGAWKAWKSKSSFPTLSTAPLEISQTARDSHISTAATTVPPKNQKPQMKMIELRADDSRRLMMPPRNGIPIGGLQSARDFCPA